MSGHTDSTIRQAADDLRKLRGNNLVERPGRSRRYHIPPPAHWTRVDRDDETLRIDMHALLDDLGIAAGTTAA